MTEFSRAVVPLVVAVPALAGLLGLLLSRSVPTARAIAVGGAGLTVVLTLVQWIAPARAADIDSLGALPLPGDLQVPLHLLSDRTSGLVAVVVAVVVLAIQVFTLWYLGKDPRFTRFLAGVSLFAAAMLLVVQSADLFLTLVGWEVMGWCSWLLIGHDSHRREARRAAYKAFVLTAVADIGMVVGFVALAARAGSTDLLAVLAAPHSAPLLGIGLFGVAIGVAGKSGLVPFHDWLPDAMEGPTPASALIHAATMVAAGSYVIGRLFGLYATHDGARLLLAVLAGLTMTYAAFLALAQRDLKRLLAYSTLSQVAIMVGALAAASVAAGTGPATGHLVGHAFFKALLFLGVGWLAVVAGAGSLPALQQRLADHDVLRWCMGIGFAALAGIPPLVGFFTKDSILAAALDGAGANSGAAVAAAWIVVVALLVTVVLTAAYCARAYLRLAPVPSLTVPDRFRNRGAAVSGDPAPELDVEEAELLTRAQRQHGSPVPLWAQGAVVLLAVLSVVGALLLVGLRGAIHLEWLSALLSLALVAAGIAIAWVASHHGARDAAAALPPRLRIGASTGFGWDRLYVGFGHGVTAVARAVAVLDRDVVDAYPRSTAVLAREAGRLGERSHRAVPSLSLVGLAVGVLVMAVIGVATW